MVLAGRSLEVSRMSGDAAADDDQWRRMLVFPRTTHRFELTEAVGGYRVGEIEGHEVRRTMLSPVREMAFVTSDRPIGVDAAEVRWWREVECHVAGANCRMGPLSRLSMRNNSGQWSQATAIPVAARAGRGLRRTGRV